MVKNREGFQAPIGDGWHEEAEGRLPRSRAPYEVFLENIFDFLWLVLTWMQKQMGKGEVSYYGLVATEVTLWLPGLVTAKVVGQNSLFIYGLDTVHLYSQASREIKFETASSSRSLNFIWEWL